MVRKRRDEQVKIRDGAGWLNLFVAGLTNR